MKHSMKWLFFVIIAPLVFAVALFSTLFILDHPFANQIKKIGGHMPIVSGLVNENAANESNGNQTAAGNKKEIEQLSLQLQQQEEEIKKLEDRLVEKDEEIVQYKDQIAKLEKQLQGNNSQTVTNETQMKKAREMLEEMSPKAAASIVTEMETSDVIALMETMDSKALGDILAKMEPERAAELTKLLLDNE